MKRVRTPEQKQRNNEAQKRRRLADPERYKANGRRSEHKRRMRRYGVDAEWFESKLKKQKNCCDICLETLKPGRGTHIDHNHFTMHVRGLICAHCNYLIGNAKEDKFRLMQAINYLERYSYQTLDNPRCPVQAWK